LALVSLLIAGCGKPKSVKVTGRYLKDGQPFSFPDKTLVTLIFIPEDDAAARKHAKSKPDLSGYEVDLPPGKYRVSFTAFPAEFQPGDAAAAPGGAPMPPPPGQANLGELYDLTSAKTLDLAVPATFATKK
jgi:hypothetical protein